MTDHPLDKYDEGGFQVSFDGGDSWQQLSLIDTHIGNLSDVAPSPDCNTTYVASINEFINETSEQEPLVIWWMLGAMPVPLYAVCDSLWLKSGTLSAGLPQASDYDDHWLRVWYGQITSNSGLLRLAPEETTDIDHVYLCDWGTRMLYHSDSKGLGEWELDTKAPFDIVDLAVKSADTIYTLSADGRVAMWDGSRWPAAHKNIDTGLKGGYAIAVLGDNVLVGGTSGDVAYSDDGGLTFTELKDGLPGNGYASVAFDSYFDTNKVVYAALSGSSENGIYRWVIDQSEEWKNLGADDELNYFNLALERAGNPQTSATTGGVLYALYYNGTANHSGVARCLTPAEEKCCGAVDWDYLEQGETGFDNVFLFAWPLKICGCLSPDTNSRLFAIDSNASYYGGLLLEEQPAGTSRLGRLWSFQDCFAKAAPLPTAPEDGAVLDSDPCNCWNDAFTLKWDRQCDACEYDIQVSLDEDFTRIMKNITAYSPAKGTTPSYVVPNKGLGDGSCGTTYYWRIRAASAETGQVIHSPWSEALTFTIGAGPEAKVKLISPSAGAIVPPKNVQFAWEAVPDATGYVFSLTNSVSGTDVVAETSVAGTTHTYTGTLEYDTPYLWTVKAMKDAAPLSHATPPFTTASAPVTPEAPATPSWVWVIIIIGAVLVIVTLVLIFRTRRV